MPVTAKLSRRFYETFGDEITNELVEWFNQVDAAYRSELRELNELNFARFDAKLEQRIAEVRQEIASLVGALQARIDTGFAGVRADMAALRAELIKWMFLFWATAALGVIGLLKF